MMGHPAPPDTSNPYVGWIAGAGVIAAVLLVATLVWIHYHG
ncbi:MAG: hypothetical protein ACREDK_04965 [Thermoplasmata archaeon]